MSSTENPLIKTERSCFSITEKQRKKVFIKSIKKTVKIGLISLIHKALQKRGLF